MRFTAGRLWQVPTVDRINPPEVYPSKAWPDVTRADKQDSTDHLRVFVKAGKRILNGAVRNRKGNGTTPLGHTVDLIQCRAKASFFSSPLYSGYHPVLLRCEPRVTGPLRARFFSVSSATLIPHSAGRTRDIFSLCRAFLIALASLFLYDVFRAPCVVQRAPSHLLHPSNIRLFHHSCFLLS